MGRPSAISNHTRRPQSACVCGDAGGHRIFALCRNPLYVGNLLIAVGFALVVHAYAFYFILLPGVAFAYIAIVAAEEAYLRQKFGQQYQDYMRRVPRWWPRLSRFPDAVAGFPFNWRRVIVKEYNTTFVLCATLTCLYFWSEYSVVGSAALPSKVSAAGAAAVWAVLYLAVRAAKKTGYLQDRTALTTVARKPSKHTHLITDMTSTKPARPTGRGSPSWKTVPGLVLGCGPWR